MSGIYVLTAIVFLIFLLTVYPFLPEKIVVRRQQLPSRSAIKSGVVRLLTNGSDPFVQRIARGAERALLECDKHIEEGSVSKSHAAWKVAWTLMESARAVAGEEENLPMCDGVKIARSIKWHRDLAGQKQEALALLDEATSYVVQAYTLTALGHSSLYGHRIKAARMCIDAASALLDQPATYGNRQIHNFMKAWKIAMDHSSRLGRSALTEYVKLVLSGAKDKVISALRPYSHDHFLINAYDWDKHWVEAVLINANAFDQNLAEAEAQLQLAENLINPARHDRVPRLIRENLGLV